MTGICRELEEDGLVKLSSPTLGGERAAMQRVVKITSNGRNYLSRLPKHDLDGAQEFIRSVKQNKPKVITGPLVLVSASILDSIDNYRAVSYTHLTLPTIYSV